MNEKDWKDGKNLDFSHADAVDTACAESIFVAGPHGRHANARPQATMSFPLAQESRRAKSKDLDCKKKVKRFC